MGKLRLDRLDMSRKIDNEDAYEKRLAKLQATMLSIQQTYFHEKRRAVIVVEGWDAAGKGGLIRRMTETLDPRGFHVWPIGPPDAIEQGTHYLYRFWTRLPRPGLLAIFDRSWYGRVLVERVEGLAAKPAWTRAYREINEFERMLVEDGVRLVKLFLHITPAEQLERFAERLTNPHKRWKITEADIRNHLRWEDYAEAIEDMFDRTSTRLAPWHAIAANHKWQARISGIETVTATLSAGVDLKAPPISESVRKAAVRLIGMKALNRAARRNGEKATRA